MARIRTIKPGFFRHESLQELETLHPGNYCMLTFAGLFTAADRAGRFEWRPKQLKLDILPFLPFDMAETLKLLETFQFITKYEVEGKSYGLIPTFLEHQCPNMREPLSRIPAPCEHSTGTMPEHGEGEREEEKERSSDSFSPLEAARGFLIEFRITGEKILRSAEQAIALRSQLSKLDALEACSQLQREYRAYLDSNPEFKKGPEKWLSECNQDFEQRKPVRQWKVVGNG